MDNTVHALVMRFPEGYSEGVYNEKRYAITKTTYNDGRSFKLYAEALGGTDYVSLNLYCTATTEHLKPCEMPVDKVLHFLRNVSPL